MEAHNGALNAVDNGTSGCLATAAVKPLHLAP